MSQLKVTSVDITPVYPNKGLVGFASCTINDAFFVSNIGIHINTAGLLGLAYPQIVLKNGFRCHAFKPIRKEFGEMIRLAVEEKYRELQDLSEKKSDGDAYEA